MGLFSRFFRTSQTKQNANDKSLPNSEIDALKVTRTYGSDNKPSVPRKPLNLGDNEKLKHYPNGYFIHVSKTGSPALFDVDADRKENFENGEIDNKKEIAMKKFEEFQSFLEYLENRDKNLYDTLSEEAELLEAKDGKWMGKVKKEIEAKGTEGVCTGKKFGSESCPAGSKRYELAKTFKKIGKEHKGKKEDKED